jgi:hypothetical protein
MLERREGPFIAPQKNLAIGVSETRTCPGGQPLWILACGSNMSGPGLSHCEIGLDRMGNASGIRSKSRICLVNSVKG